jgi:PAS domain S-box-containing protein
MTQEYGNLHLPPAVVEFNPPLTAADTPLLEVVKKILAGEGYLIVDNGPSPLGMIALKDLVPIIASAINVVSLRAKAICRQLPCQPKSESEDIFTIANLISKHNYPGYGLVEPEGKLAGLITPQSLCHYLGQDNFYQTISVQEVVQSNLGSVSPDLSVIAVSKMIGERKLTGVVIDEGLSPGIITLRDLVSVLLNPEWKTQTLKDIAPSSLPRFSKTETVAVVCQALRANSACLIGNDDFRNLALITPENILPLLTPAWQDNYLRRQQRQLSQLQRAVKIQTKQVGQEKLLAQISYRIRQSLDLDDILANTVNEVRQFLECDRVIVYQLYPDGDGVVIAESVAEGVLSILGRVIHDRFFAEDFRELYLKGRIQATSDVFTANLSPCHLDLLLSIQVQANLVVSIIFQARLWGLLAAQHCTAPRDWQEDELNLLQKLAAQVAIAIQQSEYAQKALRVADYQTAIASVGKAALVAADIESLMDAIVTIVAHTLKVEYCNLLELLPNQAAFALKAAVGWPPAWVGVAKIGSSPRWMPGYTLNMLHPVITGDLRVETRFSPCPFLHNKGIVSAAAVTIGGKDNCYGILGVYSKTTRKFRPEEINFLQTLANVLATAIEKANSQKQLDYFFNLSLDMFCIAGVDGSFKRVNSTFLTTLGYGEEELLTHNLIDFVHPEDREITLAELEKLSQGLPSINFENRWRCQDGQYRWLAWKSLPYEEGTIYAVARDITLAKQAEEQLRTLNEQLELRVKDRTEQLEQTTTQLRTLVQTAGTLLIVLNQEYRIVEWNEEAEKVFGWTRDSVLGEDYFLLFVPPAEREKLREHLNKTIQLGEVRRNLESKILTAEGNERTLLWNINRFVDASGQGIGIIACGQDIEEVRRAQLRLKLSEERFRSIFNQAAVGIVQVSLPGKLVLVNDKFTQLVGYSREELSGLDFPQLIYPDDVSETLTDLSDLLAGNKATFEREIRIQRRAGDSLWVNLTMSVVWVAVEPSYFIAVVNDISDRKRAEESLQQSEARLNSILNSLQDVVWSIALPEKQLRYINPACQIIYGRSPEELIADPTLIWKMVVGEDRQKVAQNWQNMLNNSQLGQLPPAEANNWELEYKIELPNGETRWIRDRAHLVYDRYSRAVSIDGISTDVTERHQAEEKLFKSLQEKEVLLKEIHHRVKNNLYVISGLLNLQSSYIEEEEVRNLFQDSQNRIQTMAVIHEQLYQSQDLAEIDFADYINRLVSNLFLSYNHQKSGIKPITQLEKCYLNIETAIPAGLLINELVTNAFKHAFPSVQGEVNIRLEVEREQEIKLTVADNGRGLPPHLDWENSPSLGLRLVHLLSQQLDAQVQVETGQTGTAFTLKFTALKPTRSIR